MGHTWPVSNMTSPAGVRMPKPQTRVEVRVLDPFNVCGWLWCCKVLALYHGLATASSSPMSSLQDSGDMTVYAAVLDPPRLLCHVKRRRRIWAGLARERYRGKNWCILPLPPTPRPTVRVRPAASYYQQSLPSHGKCGVTPGATGHSIKLYSCVNS